MKVTGHVTTYSLQGFRDRSRSCRHGAVATTTCEGKPGLGGASPWCSDTTGGINRYADIGQAFQRGLEG